MSPLQAALVEADRQANSEGAVWDSLRRIAGELQRLDIPYAVVGGLALQHFGIQRSTQDIDILVTPGGLERIHRKLVGHGYQPNSPGGRHLRDDVTRIRIEFLMAGEFPGDGQPKPVAFPDPGPVSAPSEVGIRFVKLETLIELKLASAMTAPHRIKDRADVLELIHVESLGSQFADRLHEYVRKDFLELASLPPPSDRD